MGQTRYPPKSRVFKSRFSFKVGQHLQQQLYLQLDSLQNSSCYLIFTTLLVHTTTPKISTKNPFLYFSQLSTNIRTYYPLTFNKIIRTISTNAPFLYTAAIFCFPIFAYNHPSNLDQKYFLHISHIASSG